MDEAAPEFYGIGHSCGHVGLRGAIVLRHALRRHRNEYRVSGFVGRLGWRDVQPDLPCADRINHTCRGKDKGSHHGAAPLSHGRRDGPHEHPRRTGIVTSAFRNPTAKRDRSRYRKALARDVQNSFNIRPVTHRTQLCSKLVCWR